MKSVSSPQPNLEGGWEPGFSQPTVGCSQGTGWGTYAGLGENFVKHSVVSLVSGVENLGIDSWQEHIIHCQ
jgi:hypothetical protein